MLTELGRPVFYRLHLSLPAAQAIGGQAVSFRAVLALAACEHAVLILN